MSFSHAFASDLDVVTDPPPSSGQTERLKTALIQKAARFLIFPEGPLGFFGEITELGQPFIRPDYQIRELLFGLHLTVAVVDLASLVTTDDVIRAGLQADPANFPTERLPDVQRSIDAAADWIELELTGAFGVA
jgi:hypothetical protein